MRIVSIVVSERADWISESKSTTIVANASEVKADKNLDFTSGKDTNIKGGKLSGEKVTGSVGGDLNIESKQDSNNYKESNKSVGASVGLGSNKAVSGSASVGKIDSNYNSVTDQSGIYAGEDGFEINVGENTDLKGGIISSEAEKDKNKIATGTLTYEDIKNEADYKAGGAGIKVNKNNDADYNEKGITPDIGMPASGEAESTTKATISKGTIEIRDKENQNQDINKLNRDTKNSLNKLGEIFDKTKIEERQELANLFGELAYNEIHKLADKNGWKDGDSEKDALHALVGGIMSELTVMGSWQGQARLRLTKWCRRNCLSSLLVNQININGQVRLSVVLYHKWFPAMRKLAQVLLRAERKIIDFLYPSMKNLRKG